MCCWSLQTQRCTRWVQFDFWASSHVLQWGGRARAHIAHRRGCSSLSMGEMKALR